MTDYTLYYWPIPFRGHFIRYALAQAGAEWDEAGFDRTAQLKDTPVADQPYPAMAPPVLHDHAGGRYLSQMPAIVMALARRHGIAHDPDEALRLVCDGSDILLEITRHHGAEMWTRPAWEAFRGRRLARWMQLHERLVRDAGAGAGGGFLSDAPEPGLSDLVLGALWHTMAERLPPLRHDLSRHAPTVTALVDRVAATPLIAALLASWADRAPLYCAGEIEASLLSMLNMADRD